MKTILVTGANGQLGNEMRLLAEKYQGYNYCFTDIAELDICDEQAVDAFVAEHQVDIIVNCAAYTAVDKAEDNVALCERLNRFAPGYLAKAIQKRGGQLIQVSTDYVFDGTAHVPYRETHPSSPNSVYGSTKLAGEQEAMKYCPETMVVRTAWLYSPYGGNFVKTIRKLGAEKESISVVNDQIGTPTCAADLAQAIVEIIPQMNESNKGVYHFSDEGVCSWYDFAHEIMALSKLDCLVKPIPSSAYPTKAKRPFYSVLSKEKIKNTFHIEIPYWKDSLVKCLKQF